MRNSAWSLVALTASILTLASFALALPTLHGGSGERESAWNLLKEWRQTMNDLDQPAQDLAVAGKPGRKAKQAEPRIRLRLVDQNGDAVVGATIACDLFTANSIGRVLEKQSEEDGSFLSHPLNPGQYQVQVSADGFLPQEPITLKIPLDQEETLIRMQMGCNIAGFLNGTDGVPRNHGFLGLRRADAESSIDMLWLEPETNGTFRFPPVAQGRWKLAWVPHQGSDVSPNLTRTIDLEPGPVYRFEITLGTNDPRVPTDPATHGVGIHPVAE